MRRSLRSWLWRVPIDHEVDEEIAFHVDMRVRELVEQGMDADSARATAMSQFGDLASLKRTCVDLGRKRERQRRLTQWLEELAHDVKFAARQLRASPTFTVVAVITLALGIGANSAMFALVDAALLRPLPFPQPERLVMVWERSEASLREMAAPLNVVDWNERNRTFDGIAGFIPGVGGMVMAGADGTAETVSRQWVTHGFFDVLGVKAIAGRTFIPDDDSRRANAVVLSEAFWRTRFGADRTVVGRDIRLDGLQFTVVGIVPKEFQLLGRTSIWALISVGQNPAARNPHVLEAFGRLKSGVSLQVASSDLTAIADDLAREFPSTNRGRGILLEPMRDVVIGNELRLTSMLFLGVVGFVLLLCCANVANLLLARGSVRARELAIRSALGAGRRRIVRQLVTESLIISALGGVLGMFIGAAILSIAPSIAPQDVVPAGVTVSFDFRVVLFASGAALLVGLLFGLVPAIQATEFSSARALASDSRTATGRGGRIRRYLVAGEVAAAVLLLFGAGLLLRTLLAVDHVERGYRADSVLTMMVDPLGSSYPTAQSLRQFFDAVEHEVSILPGVRNVAWASTLPMGPSEGGTFSFEIVGDPPLDRTVLPTADYQIVSPAYFQTLDLPVVAGRGFTSLDNGDGIPVCIVNEAFIRGHLKGRTAIGTRIAVRPVMLADGAPEVREIVGVARQVKGRPDENSDLLQIYVPIGQKMLDDIYLVVRPASGRAEVLAPSVRAAIGRVDKEQLVSVRDVMTLADIARDATAGHRVRAVMVMTFAALALLLAMVGVFGILAYSVQLRLREFAVRIALGATLPNVLGLVFATAARVVAMGGLIGLAMAVVLGRLLAAVLFGVQPLDPITFMAVTVVLILTAAVATAGPAWHAARTNPAVALRSE